MGINVRGKINIMFFRRFYQAAYHRIAVGPHTVFHTDGYLMLRTVQSFAHTSHVHRQDFRYAFRYGSAGSMPHFFIDGNMMVNIPFGRNLLFFHIFCKSKQNTHTQFIIQKPAFDISFFRNHGSGFKGHNIPRHNAEFFCLFFRTHLFVRHHLHGTETPSGSAVIVVYMDRGIFQLKGPFIYTVRPGYDPTVFPFRIIGIQTAQRGYFQPAVPFDFTDHGSQRIHMGFQQDPVFFLFPSQIHQYAAFYGFYRFISQ